MRCCGQEAKWVEQSVNLKYWYCTECKQEVTLPTSGVALQHLPSGLIPINFCSTDEINLLIKQIEETQKLMGAPRIFVQGVPLPGINYVKGHK